MYVIEQLQSIFTAFTLAYGSQLPHEIAPKEAGPELLISYHNQFGSGQLIVRKATTEDMRSREVENGMWVILVTHERGCNFAPVAGAYDQIEIINDLVKVANDRVGPSADAESAVVDA